MNPLTVINAAANVIVAGAVFDMSIRVFGRPDHPIHQHRIALISRKLISSIVICGAVLNIITLSTPSWTEVLLNVAFSLSYAWSSFYDRHAHSKHSANAKEIPRKRPSGGSRSVGKAKPNPATSGTGRKRSAAR